MLFNNPLKQKYYSYLHHQDILLVNREIDEVDIMSWEEYQLEYEDKKHEDMAEKAMFKFE